MLVLTHLALEFDAGGFIFLWERLHVDNISSRRRLNVDVGGMCGCS
jgi:hypothetical protein